MVLVVLVLVGCGGGGSSSSGGGSGGGGGTSSLLASWHVDSISQGESKFTCPSADKCGAEDRVTFMADHSVSRFDSVSGVTALGTWSVDSSNVLTLSWQDGSTSTWNYNVTGNTLVAIQINPTAGLTYTLTRS